MYFSLGTGCVIYMVGEVLAQRHSKEEELQKRTAVGENETFELHKVILLCKINTVCASMLL